MMITMILPSYISSLYSPGYSLLLILLMCVQIVIVKMYFNPNLRFEKIENLNLSLPRVWAPHDLDLFFGKKPMGFG